MESSVNSSWQTILQNQLEQRANQFNAYGEQPLDLAKNAAEFEMSRGVFPSIQVFPEKVQHIVREDLEETAQAINELQALIQTGVNPNSAGSLEKMKSYLKFCNPVIFFQTTNHGEQYQKAWNDGKTVVEPFYPWITIEQLALIQCASLLFKKIGEVYQQSELYKQSEGFRANVDHLFSVSPEVRGDIVDTVRGVEKRIAASDVGDHPIYHGTSREAFLDMLETRSLLCGHKQERVKGKRRFNTKVGKKVDQELFNISFSNDPNRRYTGEEDAVANPYMAVIHPEDTWIVSDLYTQIKSGQRFFYSDGWQLHGVDEQGYELSFDNDPSCFLMTQTQLEYYLKRIQSEERFSNSDISTWLIDKTVIIPEDILPLPKDYTESWEFKVPEEALVQIREKLTESSQKELSKEKGYVVPSGEMFDDQAGTKISSYIWVNKKAE